MKLGKGFAAKIGLSLLVSLTLIGEVTPALAAGYMVDDDGAQCPTAGYTTIQAAVDAAQLAGGSNKTITVCAGLYSENVVIENVSKLKLIAKKDVILGPALANSGTAVITVNDSAGVTVSGFRLDDLAAGTPAMPSSSAIYYRQSTGSILKNVTDHFTCARTILVDNSINLMAAPLTISGNQLTNDNCSGITVTGGMKPKITKNQVSISPANASPDGVYGIAVTGATSATVSGNTVISSWVTGSAQDPLGIMFFISPKTKVSGNTITGFHFGVSTQAFCDPMGSSIDGSKISGNKINHTGVPISVSAVSGPTCTPTANSVKISGNKITNAPGTPFPVVVRVEAVIAMGDAAPSIDKTSITGNKWSGYTAFLSQFGATHLVVKSNKPTN